MARFAFRLQVETDLVQDCLSDIHRISVALASRHGDAFRRLDRRVEAIIEGDMPTAEGFGWPELAPGHMVMTPPQEWVSVVAEARALGVI